MLDYIYFVVIAISFYTMYMFDGKSHIAQVTLVVYYFHKKRKTKGFLIPLHLFHLSFISHVFLPLPDEIVKLNKQKLN